MDLPGDERPSQGPSLLLLKPSEVGVLYDCLAAVDAALRRCNLRYVVLAGSLLGAVRSASILFCDDDIDIGIFEDEYEEALRVLSTALKGIAMLVRRPWPGADRLRPCAAPHLWLDVFVLRCYETVEALSSLVSTKDNGCAQPATYVERIISTVYGADIDPRARRWPLFHYDARKSVELWPSEFFCAEELFPLREYNFGHLRVWGPARPVTYLRRTYGIDCFDVFTVATNHAPWSLTIKQRLLDLSNDLVACPKQASIDRDPLVDDSVGAALAASSSVGEGKEPRAIIPGLATPHSTTRMLTDEQYLPVQHPHVKKRVRTRHGRAALRAFLAAEAHDVSRGVELTAEGMDGTPCVPDVSIPGTSEPVVSQTVSVLHRPYDGREIATRTTPAPDVLPRPAWFGASLAHASGQSSEAFVFDATLRAAMEVHIEKARKARSVRLASRPLSSGALLTCGTLFQEARLSFDPARFCLSVTLGQALGLPCESISRGPATWHEVLHDSAAKDRAMARLTSASLRAPFVAAYDAFIASVVAPHIGDAAGDGCDAVYVQAFPCVRLIRPGDFSLGPHCDAAYGFGPANVNIVVPLCEAGMGSHALYVESSPGLEDWHPIKGGEGSATRFHGGELLGTCQLLSRGCSLTLRLPSERSPVPTLHERKRHDLDAAQP